ncbi:hypothetical protein FDK38_000766 [Candidozyma auris]|nr:hypothetical protein FDK38_000766 [[Candida] auris]
MAGPQERRKPFRGKRFHKDLREYKNQEIKRSLVHRARLRKSYFKLLEKEGEEGEANSRDAKGHKEVASSDESPNSDSESSASEGENSESEDEDEISQSSSVKQRAPLPPQRPPKKEVAKKRPMDFLERVKLAKERKEQQKEEKLRRIQEKRRMIEQKQKEREKRKESLSKKTRTGQPVMGPKISNLLEKIRNNQ